MAGIKIRNLSEEFSFGSVISGVDSDLLAVTLCHTTNIDHTITVGCRARPHNAPKDHLRFTANSSGMK